MSNTPIPNAAEYAEQFGPLGSPPPTATMPPNGIEPATHEYLLEVARRAAELGGPQIEPVPAVRRSAGSV